MIQVTATMRTLVAIEPVDLRKGIDGLAQFCCEKLAADPFSGCLFIFRSRLGTAIKALCFDGQGYWLAQKRLSQDRFKWWPEASGPAKSLEAYEAQLLMAAGAAGRSPCRSVRFQSHASTIVNQKALAGCTLHPARKAIMEILIQV